MKELSIEEKARNYDGVREKIAIRFGSNVAEEIFSEYEESEDERIRKEIIYHIQHCDDTIDEVAEKRMIAWLEKQGEQKSVDDLTPQEAMDVAVAKCFEEGEQKPDDKIQLGKKYKCIASPRYSTFMIGEIYKPEDKFLCSLMNFCSDCFEPIEDEQKPAEWSEEIEAAISLLKHIAEEQEKDYCPHNANALRKAAQYLKSIRPQSQWKPSDEQMKALKDALNDAICQYDFKGSLIKEEVTRKHAEIIESLYNDLQKLKEE